MRKTGKKNCHGEALHLHGNVPRRRKAVNEGVSSLKKRKGEESCRPDGTLGVINVTNDLHKYFYKKMTLLFKHIYINEIFP